MKNLRSIFGFLLVLTILFSCRQEPSAELGWNGTEKVVKITDQNGQQFLMNYLLYQSLFNNGGYNNVIHHYHSAPSRYTAYTSKSFRASKVQPTSTKGFNTNFRKVEARRSTLNRARSQYSGSKSSGSSFFKKSSPSRSSWSRSSSSRSSSRRR